MIGSCKLWSGSVGAELYPWEVEADAPRDVELYPWEEEDKAPRDVDCKN